MNADTSSEPEGLTRRVLINILEAFFRRPWLHLLPLVLMLALAVGSVVQAKPEYTAVGTLSATNDSPIADLTDSNSSAGASFDSPAIVTQRQVSERITTNEFLDIVIEQAGLTSAVKAAPLLREEIRKSLFATADGDNLVRVGAKSDNPELAFQLAKATITSFRQDVVDSQLRQSTETEAVVQKRVDQATADVTAARQALQVFADANPAASADTMTLSDSNKLAQLQGDLTRQQDKLFAAEDALGQAQDQNREAASVVNQRLRIVDPPTQPQAAQSRTKKAILSVAVFGTLGVILSLASVVLAAMLDRTVRVPGDISAKFGVDVLAIVPNVKR